jgi:hypothetical protein
MKPNTGKRIKMTKISARMAPNTGTGELSGSLGAAAGTADSELSVILRSSAMTAATRSAIKRTAPL